MINYSFTFTIADVIICTLLMIIAVFFHEIGHWIALKGFNGWKTKIKIYWKNGAFRCGENKHYKNLDSGQLIVVYITGIIAGAIVLSILPFGLLFYFLTAIYLIGCRVDMKLIWEELKA